MTPVDQDVLAALTSGIQSEVASYVFYVAASKKSEATQHKEMLERLAHEEKVHFHILERQYDSLIRSEKWISTADMLKQEGLPEITEQMSQQHQALIDEVGRADSMERILDIAFKLEKDAHELFARAAGLVDSPGGKQMFEQLAKFERGHMRMIEDMKGQI